jgi:hypothetical protein
MSDKPAEKSAATETSTSSSRRTKNFVVGDVVEVEAGATVTRPDGSTATVGKGGFALSTPGTYKLGDREVSAK